MFARRNKLWESLRRKERLRQGLTWTRDRIARQRLRITHLKRDGEGPRNIPPENIVWIFGSGRTGSTWLSGMMGNLPDHTAWNEPLVGYLFGHTYYERAEARANDLTDRHFIMGTDRRIWLHSIRRFVLEQATARFPERIDGGYLVIKEPHGSLGAPLLMDALPESRMVFLIRHPGDVVSSALDAHRKGGWARARRGKRQATAAQERPDRFVSSRSRAYLRDIQHVKQAYEAHEGRKVLIRYEDLRMDTLGVLKRIYSALGMTIYERDLARTVEKHLWENVPEEEKGEGKFYRKATPGAWREDLTPEQIRILVETTRPLLDEFYS